MEFDIGGHSYRVGKLNAFDQLNVARRLSQALIPIGNLRSMADPKPDDAALARAFVTLTSQIPVDDMDQARNILFAVVTRDLGGDRGWARITAPNGSLMYDDIDLAGLSAIMVKALDANGLIDFFVDPASGSPDPTRAASNG